MPPDRQHAPSGSRAAPIPPEYERSDFHFGAQASNAITKLQNAAQNIISNLGPRPEPFQYTAIASTDEIRVLRVMPGPHNNMLFCTLLPSALAMAHNKPSASVAKSYTYDALSYCWGGEERLERPMVEIRLCNYNSTDHSRFSWDNFEYQSFYVQPNLHDALRQLRHEHQHVTLWVDALCINQKDMIEKTAQVKRMHEIYSQAENVLVWLGAGDADETKRTFDFLRKTLKLQNFEDLIERQPVDRPEDNRETAQQLMLVIELMKNKWFSRRWIIQEISLAKAATVLWGQEPIGWTDFADAIAIFTTKYDKIKEILRSNTNYSTPSVGDFQAWGANTLVTASQNLFRTTNDGAFLQRLLTLEVLVSQFQAFEALNPRDNIYAMLSIAKDTSPAEPLARTTWTKTPALETNSADIAATEDTSVPPPMSRTEPDPRISPDYSKCLMDVYTDFTEYCIEHSDSLDILCRHWAPVPTKRQSPKSHQVSSGPEDVWTLPSWIPSIEGHAFGTPRERLNGRKNADSLVGSSERQFQKNYDASCGLRPWFEFGRYSLEDLSEDPQATDQASSEQRPSTPSQAVPSQNEKSLVFNGTLSVRGFRLDEIQHLTGRIPSGMIMQQVFEMGGWIFPASENYQVPDQLWRTLVADRDPNGGNAPNWYRRACWESLVRVNSSCDLETEMVMNKPGTPKAVYDFLKRVQAVTWGRCCLKTKGTHNRHPLLGLGPPKSRVGDIICILFGCSVPVVLREFKRSDDHYFEIVGECYIHGLMDGEAISRRHKTQDLHPYDRTSAETFKLR